MSEVKDIKEIRKEAIKQLREITELSKDEIKNGDEITAILDKFDLASLIVALDYIEELEQKVEIRDKIKELEKMREHYDKNEDAEWGEFNKYEWISYLIEELTELLKGE